MVVCAITSYLLDFFVRVTFVIFLNDSYTSFLQEKKALGIAWPQHKTQRNLVLGVKAGYDFIFGTLWYFITKCDWYYYYNISAIIKCDKSLLQNVSILLQNAAVNIKCVGRLSWFVLNVN